MHQTGRTGFYLRVLEEGIVEAGDDIETLGRDPGEVTVKDITQLHSGSEKGNAELMRQAISIAALGESWRGYFEHKLKDMETGT